MHQGKLLAALALAITTTSAVAQTPPPPPQPMREFRAAWIATVSNIDWPSNRTRTTAQAQAELIAQFDVAAQLKLNAIIFQVRPACDALYPSDIEPWSYWLTNREGRAPSPVWDPLQFAIDQAHARGMELHAWMNPYRARTSTVYTLATNHIANRRPDLIESYNGFLWLNPGEPDVLDYSLSVVMDVVNRYDIDGLHFDDYFYPYSDGTSFPDADTYATYQGGGGTLSLANWRRDNVNRFVQRTYTSIKEAKPTVKFGISPFGIWRPGNPSGIVGMDAYNSIYCDARLWIRNGWVDYLSPQLYWEIDPPQQSYTALLDWWIGNSYQGRPIWPGMGLYKITNNSWPSNEIVRQVTEARNRPGSRGTIAYNFSALQDNIGGVRTDLQTNAFQLPALVPAATWLDSTPPSAPTVTVSRTNGVTLNWTPTGTEASFRYVVSWYRNGAWEQTILNQASRSTTIPNSIAQPPTHVSVVAVDRSGNLSAAPVLSLIAAPGGWVLR
ncbi:family 10 glycosylhydrolase [bacterium]|nr:family 10 glycosylhydrolase [bacterium]